MNKYNNKAIENISNDMRYSVKKAQDHALNLAEANGLREGTYVRHTYQYFGEEKPIIKDYIVSRIDTKCGLYVYGFKILKNGSVGEHEHCVCSAEDLEIIQIDGDSNER